MFVVVVVFCVFCVFLCFVFCFPFRSKVYCSPIIQASASVYLPLAQCKIPPAPLHLEPLPPPPPPPPNPPPKKKKKKNRKRKTNKQTNRTKLQANHVSVDCFLLLLLLVFFISLFYLIYLFIIFYHFISAIYSCMYLFIYLSIHLFISLFGGPVCLSFYQLKTPTTNILLAPSLHSALSPIVLNNIRNNNGDDR